MPGPLAAADPVAAVDHRAIEARPAVDPVACAAARDDPVAARSAEQRVAPPSAIQAI